MIQFHSLLEDKRYRDLQDSIDESRTLVEELTLALMCDNVELRALARDAANLYLERKTYEHVPQ